LENGWRTTGRYAAIMIDVIPHFNDTRLASILPYLYSELSSQVVEDGKGR